MYPACKYAMTAITECLRQEVSFQEMGIKISVNYTIFKFKILIIFHKIKLILFARILALVLWKMTYLQHLERITMSW